MKLGKMAFFAVVGLTGCGNDRGGHETPAAVTPEGEGGSGGSAAGASGVGGTGESGGSAGTGAGGSAGGAGAGGIAGSGGTGGTSVDVDAAVANIDVNLE